MQSANVKGDVKRLKSKFGKTYKHIGGTEDEEEERQRAKRKRKKEKQKE